MDVRAAVLFYSLEPGALEPFWPGRPCCNPISLQVPETFAGVVTKGVTLRLLEVEGLPV